MKEVNVYNVTITEVPEDTELKPCIRHIYVVANNINDAIYSLTMDDKPFCKKEDITSITFDKKVYCSNYL